MGGKISTAKDMADKMSDVVTCKIPLVTSIAIRILHQTMMGGKYVK